MHIDGAVRDQPAFAPGAIEHLLAGEDAAGMPNEQFEELELLRCKCDFAALAVDTKFLGIDRNRSVTQLALRAIRDLRGSRPLVASQDRFAPGQQFARTE